MSQEGGYSDRGNCGIGNKGVWSLGAMQKTAESDEMGKVIGE